LTEVSFHFGVPDRWTYTCRLLRKAARRGATVVVTGAPAALQHLDRLLWTFDPIEFVPHVLLQRGQPAAGHLAPTPVWLSADPLTAPAHDVLVNLGADAPAGFESYARLIEIVSNDDAERAAARVRWKHYQSRGYPIQHHEAAE